jgi:hypothetical protein
LRVISAERYKEISSASKLSTVIVAFATVVDFLSAVSARAPMPALARALAKLWVSSAIKMPSQAKFNQSNTKV